MDSMTPTQEAAEREAVAQRLRDACASVRAKSYPLADLIPLMQRAADALSQQGGGVVAPGYKIVPVEPTPEMLTAAGPMSNYDFEAPGASPDADHAEWYRAMLAAAPPAPQEARELLTDDEIDAVTIAYWGNRLTGGMLAAYRAYSRAVIAATAKGERG